MSNQTERTSDSEGRRAYTSPYTATINRITGGLCDARHVEAYMGAHRGRRAGRCGTARAVLRDARAMTASKAIWINAKGEEILLNVLGQSRWGRDYVQVQKATATHPMHGLFSISKSAIQMVS